MKDRPISRRTVLAGTAAASALSLSGFPARSEVQWKKYAGTKLEVILAKGPRGDVLQKNIKEAEVYTRAAERRRLANDAMHLLAGTKSVEIFPTCEAHAAQVGKNQSKKLVKSVCLNGDGAQERTRTSTPRGAST